MKALLVPSDGSGVVDSHVHVSTADKDRFPRGGLFGSAPAFTAPVEDFLATMTAAKIDQAVLVQPSLYGFDHSYLMHCLAAHPETFVGIALGNHSSAAFIDELEELVRVGPIRGIRLAPMISPGRGWFEPKVEPLASAAARLGLTLNLLCDPQGLPAADEWIARHPELSIIVDHLGRPDLAPGPLEASCDGLLRLARHDNVFVKLTALPVMSNSCYPHRDVWPWIVATVEAYGAERLLWGSDHPFTAPGGEYADSLTILDEVLPNISAADRHSIVSGTARKLYRIPDRRKGT
jgi:predicted TIM-barrel fold metal-dependent hydrolase